MVYGVGDIWPHVRPAGGRRRGAGSWRERGVVAAVGTRRGEGRVLDGCDRQRRERGEGLAGVGQRDVGVALHGERDCRVAGEGLGDLGRHAGAGEAGDEGVAEGVEVGDAAGIEDIATAIHR